MTDRKERPNLTEDEKSRFVKACINGVDPKENCPLCGRKIAGTRDVRYRFDKELVSWVQDHAAFNCQDCDRKWAVVIHENYESLLESEE